MGHYSHYIIYGSHDIMIKKFLKTHNYLNVKICIKHSDIIEQLIHTFTEENNYCKSWLRARDSNRIVYIIIYTNQCRNILYFENNVFLIINTI